MAARRLEPQADWLPAVAAGSSSDAHAAFLGEEYLLQDGMKCRSEQYA